MIIGNNIIYYKIIQTVFDIIFIKNFEHICYQLLFYIYTLLNLIKPSNKTYNTLFLLIKWPIITKILKTFSIIYLSQEIYNK